MEKARSDMQSWDRRERQLHSSAFNKWRVRPSRGMEGVVRVITDHRPFKHCKLTQVDKC